MKIYIKPGTMHPEIHRHLILEDKNGIYVTGYIYARDKDAMTSIYKNGMTTIDVEGYGRITIPDDNIVKIDPASV